MKFETIIIGSGISALTSGIKLAKAGQKCVILNNGMNTLHYATGALDLCGYNSKGEMVSDPFTAINELRQNNANHPYNFCTDEEIKEAMSFIKEELTTGGLKMACNEEKNHYKITTLGAIQPTYLSQESVYSEDLVAEIKKEKKIAVFNFTGYRDFDTSMFATNIKKQFGKEIEVIEGEIDVPITDERYNKFEFRSIDYARLFNTDTHMVDIARQILFQANGAKIIFIPAFLSLDNFENALKSLEEKSGTKIYEVATPAPSIPGMRINETLLKIYQDAGGLLLRGEKAISGKIENGKVTSIRTKMNDNVELQADNYILATGSFISGGLKSGYNEMSEPIFNLKLDTDTDRRNWYSKKLFDQAGQKFLEYGVKIDKNLNPQDQAGTVVTNLYCTGTVVSGFNFVTEGSGSGVAVATAYKAAKNICK